MFMPNDNIIYARKLLCKYLRETAKEKGLSTYKIAELTGFEQPNVFRMLSGNHNITLDNLITLCDVIDTYVFIIDKNAEDELVETMKNRWRRPADQG